MDYRDEERDARDEAEDAGFAEVADADPYEGPAETETGILCGAHGRFQRVRHATPDDVRRCYAIRDEMRAEAAAEAEAEHAAEVAYARDREAMAERGTWFGPVTEADSWGEDDDALDAERARAEAARRADSDWSWRYQNTHGRAENE